MAVRAAQCEHAEDTRVLGAADSTPPLPPRQLRREPACQLAHLLMSDPAPALRVLTNLDHEGQGQAAAPAITARRMGAVGAITRRFGTDAGEGYFLAEKPPASPLGRMHSACLVFVGQAMVERRHARVTVVPVDLRTVLTKSVEDA